MKYNSVTFNTQIINPSFMNNNILTYLRIKESDMFLDFNDKQITIENKTYQIDNVFHGANQIEVYQRISKEILSKCIQGYNCSVFAYGQTGSGKTYTIQGTECNPGLVQRSLSFLHNNYDELKLSFIEIYNENTIDLSDPANNLNIREDPLTGVTVDFLTVFSSRSLIESLEFYQKGIINRKTAGTELNENSSRSHSIFTIQLETKMKNVVKRSKLVFVDLAGSEKIGDIEIERFKETVNINKSLLCLGKIVHKLGTNDKWHISYRDSKLTFLLKDSLGGNSKLAIIGTINPENQQDTLNTLNFLNRSKLICNSPSINYDTTKSSVNDLVENLKLLDEENAYLKNELAQMKMEIGENNANSLLYCIKNFKKNVLALNTEFDKIDKNFQNLVNIYYDGNKRILLDISRKINDINKYRKKNLKLLLKRKDKLNDGIDSDSSTE